MYMLRKLPLPRHPYAYTHIHTSIHVSETWFSSSLPAAESVLPRLIPSNHQHVTSGVAYLPSFLMSAHIVQLSGALLTTDGN